MGEIRIVSPSKTRGYPYVQVKDRKAQMKYGQGLQEQIVYSSSESSHLELCLCKRM